MLHLLAHTLSRPRKKNFLVSLSLSSEVNEPQISTCNPTVIAQLVTGLVPWHLLIESSLSVFPWHACACVPVHHIRYIGRIQQDVNLFSNPSSPSHGCLADAQV